MRAAAEGGRGGRGPSPRRRAVGAELGLAGHAMPGRRARRISNIRGPRCVRRFSAGSVCSFFSPCYWRARRTALRTLSLIDGQSAGTTFCTGTPLLLGAPPCTSPQLFCDCSVINLRRSLYTVSVPGNILQIDLRSRWVINVQRPTDPLPALCTLPQSLLCETDAWKKKGGGLIRGR